MLTSHSCIEAMESRRLLTAYTFNFSSGPDTVGAVAATIGGSSGVALGVFVDSTFFTYYGTLSGTTLTIVGATSASSPPAGNTFAAATYTTIGTDPLIVNLDGDGDNFAVNSGVSSSQRFVVDGSTGADTISGWSANDTLYGGDGADVLDALGGTDSIYGGDQADSILGGTQNDIIYGGSGNDTVFAQGGNDILYGEGGSDSLVGDAGNDTIDGGLQGDSLLGGSGLDTFFAAGDSSAVDTVDFNGVDDVWGSRDNNEVII